MTVFRLSSMRAPKDSRSSAANQYADVHFVVVALIRIILCEALILHSIEGDDDVGDWLIQQFFVRCGMAVEYILPSNILHQLGAFDFSALKKTLSVIRLICYVVTC